MAAYPRRDGEKQRLPVLNAFKATIKAGADVEQMVEAARCYASSHATRKIIGTKFIPAAARWLKAERWRDHAPTMSTNPIYLKEPRRLQALEEFGHISDEHQSNRKRRAGEPVPCGCG